MNENKKLGSLLSKIEEQAAEEIQNIENILKEKKDQRRKEFEEKKREFAEEEKKKHERYGELEKTKMISSARLQARRDVLSGMRKVIETVFDEAAKGLEKLPKKEAGAAAEKLLEKMVSTGEETIIPSGKIDVFSKDFINDLNRRRGWKLSLERPDKNLDGWFMLQGANYTVSADSSAVKDYFKERCERRVVERLFGKKHLKNDS